MCLRRCEATNADRGDGNDDMTSTVDCAKPKANKSNEQ